MLLFVLAYLGGAFTIVSPCILPVLPFVFARSDQPFLRSGLPMLLGMAATFTLVATLAAVGGGWAVDANQYGRAVAMAVLALFGATLLFPAFSDRLTRPLVVLGERLSQSIAGHSQSRGSALVPSLFLGVATGLLWAPCAGPILGLILTGAALQGANLNTTFLLLTYAAGAATSLGLALLVGGRVFTLMKKSLGVGAWIRRGLGALVLLAVVAITFHLDTGLLTRISLASTAGIEQSLLDFLHPAAKQNQHSSVIMSGNPAMMMMKANPAKMTGNPAMMMTAKAKAPSETLPVEGALPPLDGAVAWINSPPLTPADLKGKVVLIDFWTYSCINCLRTIPYVEAWAEKYRSQGLVVIGVHSPEFAFEKNIDNVRNAVAQFKITYPVAVDNNYAIWRAFNNNAWPADYFIDVQGRIRHDYEGEGDYDKSEHIIQQLLAEAGAHVDASSLVAVHGAGAEAAADGIDIESPETYIGYERADGFVSPGGAVRDAPHVYSSAKPDLNQWALAGDWTIGGEHAVLNQKGGHILFEFHARDLHLVLGPSADGKPIHFRVTLDGAAPGTNHGVDIDAAGNGVVTGQRLYQLIRQAGPVADHSFEIEFLDPGVQAYSFTFG